MGELIAHIADFSNINLKKEQSLFEHLKNCAIHSQELASDIGIPTMCFLVGLLHDAGKSSVAFQEYIRGNNKGHVIHSSTGARYLQKLFKELWAGNPEYRVKVDQNERRKRKLYTELMQYAILAHHGLFDILEKDQYKFGQRLLLNPNMGESKANETIFFKELNDWCAEEFNQTLSEMFIQGYEEFSVWNDKKLKLLESYNDSNNKNDKVIARTFYEGAMARLILAILKDADIFDSSNFGREIIDKRYNTDEMNVVWSQLSERIQHFYSQFKEPTNRLNKVRGLLADEVLDKANQCAKGNFKLDMPVGSGKTYASLRFAIENAKVFQKNRIYYTTAFLSVLEQNAQEIQEVLTDKGRYPAYDAYILEHHSNVISDNIEQNNFSNNGDIADYTESEDYDYVNYLRESWEVPVILTTLVQLSNTLFAGRAVSIRRFSKLINSTIIIDEIQSLPLEIIYNFNLMMNFLTHMMKVTLVHCTATPPSYDQKTVLAYPCIYGLCSIKKDLVGHKNEQVLTELTSKENSKDEVFSRVVYKSLLGENCQKIFDTEELASHIISRLNTEKSILVVLNTKKAVITLYDALKNCLADEDIALYNMTTNQCAAHRLDYIKAIKTQLKALRKGEEGTPVICISTKLIEAGVDVDFDIVYRSLIGIDSIMQSAGRCNREGKRTKKGIVYIMRYGVEDLSRLPLFNVAQKVILNMLSTNVDRTNWKFDEEDSSYLMANSISELLEQYYKSLYQTLILQNVAFLQYPIKLKNWKPELNTTLLDLLSKNKKIQEAADQGIDTMKATIENTLRRSGRPVGIVNSGSNNRGTNKPDNSKRKGKGALMQSFKTAGENFHLIDNDNVTVIVPYQNEECSQLMELLYDLIEKIKVERAIADYGRLKHLLKRLQRYTVSIRKDLIKDYKISLELDKQICILQSEDYDIEKGLIHGDMNELIF